MTGGGSSAAEVLSTFSEAVQQTIAARGDEQALTFLPDGEIERAESFSFAELDGAARTVAVDLQATGVGRGDRVMLLQQPGFHMVIGFLGCIYAGAIAVPAYPPSPFMGSRGDERLRSILRDAGATAVLTASTLMPLLQNLRDSDAALSWVLTDEPAGAADAYEPVEVSPGDVVFLQYTSGSTSDPRGVRVTHGSLVANTRMLCDAFGLSDKSICCSWVPPFHDMGLIGGILTPLAAGMHSVQMAPEAFLRRPERWLRALTHYGATYSGAPNFAYDLCVRRVENLDGLDLSRWAVAINGAEPVREKTLAAFADKFAPCGFDAASLYAAYGLAEATLLVSTRPRGADSTLSVSPEALADGRLELEDAANGRPLVSCGPPVSGTEVAIVDPESGDELADGVVGEIWVSGPHVCDGYWNSPTLSAEVFPAGTLRTGDLGFLWQGEVFVTGRMKDLLIIRGRNHYPQDLEQTMEAAAPDLRPGCGVAVTLGTDTGERLVLIQELTRASKGDPEALVEAIRRQVNEGHGVAVDEIVLVKSGSVQKTTSGKVRRSSTSAALEAGELTIIHRWTAST
jgi:acyl-CoA synthetase (AMP-forming)/AMP-acid ligase II